MSNRKSQLSTSGRGIRYATNTRRSAYRAERGSASRGTTICGLYLPADSHVKSCPRRVSTGRVPTCARMDVRLVQPPLGSQHPIFRGKRRKLKSIRLPLFPPPAFMPPQSSKMPPPKPTSQTANKSDSLISRREAKANKSDSLISKPTTKSDSLTSRLDFT